MPFSRRIRNCSLLKTALHSSSDFAPGYDILSFSDADADAAADEPNKDPRNGIVGIDFNTLDLKNGETPRWLVALRAWWRVVVFKERMEIVRRMEGRGGRRMYRRFGRIVV